MMSWVLLKKFKRQRAWMCPSVSASALVGYTHVCGFNNKQVLSLQRNGWQALKQSLQNKHLRKPLNFGVLLKLCFGVFKEDFKNK